VALRTWSGSPAQVVAVRFDEVEGVQEHVPVMLVVADTLERCEPVVSSIKGAGPLGPTPAWNA
jgi:hypothetical protein